MDILASPRPEIEQSSFTELVPEVLREYMGITRSRMLAYLPQKEPREHLYDIIADYPLRGGRGLRPSICIANAKAHGASDGAAVLSAAAIEIMHNAMLVHDDIEDESELRRGKPTLHELHGVPIAINAGDTMILMALQPLIDNVEVLGAATAMEIFQEVIRMARESAEGQAMELGWRKDNQFQLSEKDYQLMVAKKTCWLTIIHPLRVGALIGTRQKSQLPPFIRLGYFLGTAFQIQDDLLNLIGDPIKYGKELNGDIEEGKRTLMLIRLFEKANKKELKELQRIFDMERLERTQYVELVRDLMDKYSCIEYARRVAHTMAGAALHEFDMIYGKLKPSRDKDFINGLIHWVIERS